jgi:ATP-dependent DNA helicase RecQ
LAVTGEVPGGPVLLVDDVARSTWTVTACAALLHDAGCGPVLPLVAHRRP